jgi:hypothetical protein
MKAKLVPLIWAFFFFSCTTPNYSSLIGEKLDLPKSIVDKRIEIRNSGIRTIFWLNEDYALDTKLKSRLKDTMVQNIDSDTFILLARKLEDDLNHLATIASHKIYLIDQTEITFPELFEGQKSLPSCIFLTSNDYKILSIEKLTGNRSK